MLSIWPDTEEKLIEAAKTQLADLAKRMNLEETVQLVTFNGYPNVSINSYAEENQVDLIVIGHNAKHGLLGLLMGSTAETVTKHAKSDVLVMRVPESA